MIPSIPWIRALICQFYIIYSIQHYSILLYIVGIVALELIYLIIHLYKLFY